MSEEISKLAIEQQKAEKAEEEKSGKKRDIIKNIAIIFLSVMLILTFFSNTIMNYSLPQVSTELVTSGTIKTQLRKQGVLEAVDPYNLEVKETRTIKSVHVKEGDTVKAGDVIYELEGEESSELDSARAALKTAETTYQKGIISSGLGADQLISIQAGAEVNLAEAQKTIAEYDRQIKDYLTEIEQHDANIKLLTLEKDRLDSKIDNSAALNEASKAKEYATAAYDAEAPALQDIITKYQKSEVHSPEQTEAYNKAVARLGELEKAKRDAAQRVTDATYAPSVNQDVAQKIKDLTAQIANETAAKELTETAKTDTAARKKEYVDNISNKIDATENYAKLIAAQEKVEKLEKEALGSSITSPVDGVILTVAKRAGEKTDPNSPVAVIRLEGKGYRCSISVDTKEAKTVKVGDLVTFEDYGMDDVKINLVAINPDKSDPQNRRTLVFDLYGENLEVGQTISIAVGNASSNYSLTVPKTALYNDKKGDFILVLDEKSAPFGKRYIAKRVEVKVLSKDETRAAIEAEIEQWGTYVISNSTKPIKAGSQVRLANDTGSN